MKGRWAVPVATVLAALDAFALIVPNDALLIAAVLLKPKHWRQIAIWVSVGSAIGAAVFAALTSAYGEPMLRHLSPEIMNSKYWLDFSNAINDHGLWGLALISFSPLPQHAAVAIAGLARMPFWDVLIAVFIGRLVKYYLLAWCAVKSPDLLRKLHLLPPEEEKEEAAPKSV